MEKSATKSRKKSPHLGYGLMRKQVEADLSATLCLALDEAPRRQI
jgi:hypothetical protein